MKIVAPLRIHGAAEICKWPFVGKVFGHQNATRIDLFTQSLTDGMKKVPAAARA